MWSGTCSPGRQTSGNSKIGIRSLTRLILGAGGSRYADCGLRPEISRL
jgi:hypothetical protein